MLRYMFAVMAFIFLPSISKALEVGDSVLRRSITFGEAEIKFADFHGKSNLIVVGDMAEHSEVIAQLERRAVKYDATLLRLQGEGEILVIDKSGYVRWKFPHASDSVQSTIEELESELTKLKRDEPLPIGSPAPEFRLVDVESGLLFNLSKYKGKKHVLATLLLQTY